jgi:hypothetical protein
VQLVTLGLGDLPEAVQHLLVPLVAAVAEIEPRDVEAWQNHGKTHHKSWQKSSERRRGPGSCRKKQSGRTFWQNSQAQAPNH